MNWRGFQHIMCHLSSHPVAQRWDGWGKSQGCWCRTSSWQQNPGALVLLFHRRCCFQSVVFGTCTDHLTFVWFLQSGTQKHHSGSVHWQLWQTWCRLKHPIKENVLSVSLVMYYYVFGKVVKEYIKTGCWGRWHVLITRPKWWAGFITGQLFVSSQKSCQLLVESCRISQICVCQTFIIPHDGTSPPGLVRNTYFLVPARPFVTLSQAIRRFYVSNEWGCILLLSFSLIYVSTIRTTQDCT